MCRKTVILFIFLCTSFTNMLVAQDSSEHPLIAYFNQQMYRLSDTTLIAYDACLPNETIVGQFTLAPDGTQFIIRTLAKDLSDAITEFGNSGNASYPPNYWLCNPQQNSLRPLIRQEYSDNDFSDGLPSQKQTHSDVQWSPDSSQFAWVQLHLQSKQQSLMIFDLETQQIRDIVLDIPRSATAAAAEFIGWTEHALLLWIYEFDETTFYNAESLYLIDPQSFDVLAQYEILNDGEGSDVIVYRTLAEFNQQTVYAIELAEAGWQLINLETQERLWSEGMILLRATDVSDGMHLQVEADDYYHVNWRVLNTPTMTFDDYPSNRIALSPDGEQIAYADNDLHLYSQQGSIIDIDHSAGFADDLTAQIIWGSMTHIFVSDDMPITVTHDATPMSRQCDDTSVSRVQAGQEAEIISESIPNRIRLTPTVDSAIIGSIPPQASFTVLDGFDCADGYFWVEIRYNGVVGWTAEGRNRSYFLAPSD